MNRMIRCTLGAVIGNSKIFKFSNYVDTTQSLDIFVDEGSSLGESNPNPNAPSFEIGPEASSSHTSEKNRSPSPSSLLVQFRTGPVLIAVQSCHFLKMILVLN